MHEERRFIPLSALQHYAFCPRQCALIHNEQLWQDNFFTAQGNVLHERIDGGETELKNGVRYERGVNVCSEIHGLIGKLDLLEVNLKNNIYTPIEYKRGSVKKDDWDKVQLCAQSLCLEEMLSTSITVGAIWYMKNRKREYIEIDKLLRYRTIGIINEVRELFSSNKTPPATFDKKCNSCSLYNLCMPELNYTHKNKNYMQELFSMEKS